MSSTQAERGSCWRGFGAWLLHSMRDDNPVLANAFTHALDALYRRNQKDPLLRFAEDALALVEGHRFEGYGEEW